MSKKVKYNDVFHNKSNILGVFAHPDDADVFFGGTIARLISEGKNFNLLITTTGSRGSKNHRIKEQALGNKRMLEEKKAMSILGVKSENIHSLGHNDGEITNSYRTIGEIAEYIRLIKPDIVFTHEVEGYYQKSYIRNHYISHRDHRNTGLSTIDAIYPFARDRSFFPEQFKNHIKPHSVFEVCFSDDRERNLEVDITKFIDKKRNALLCHKSQFSKEQNPKLLDKLIKLHKVGNRFYEWAHYIKLLF